MSEVQTSHMLIVHKYNCQILNLNMRLLFSIQSSKRWKRKYTNVRTNKWNAFIIKTTSRANSRIIVYITVEWSTALVFKLAYWFKQTTTKSIISNCSNSPNSTISQLKKYIQKRNKVIKIYFEIGIKW